MLSTRAGTPGAARKAKQGPVAVSPALVLIMGTNTLSQPSGSVKIVDKGLIKIIPNITE